MNKHSALNYTNSAFGHTCLQAPILAMPHQLALLLIGGIPAAPQELKCPKLQKRQEWLQLAKILLQGPPSRITERSVKFLLELSRSLAPNPLPRLCWHASGGPAMPVIQVGLADMLLVQKVLPAVVFRAHIRRGGA